MCRRRPERWPCGYPNVPAPQVAIDHWKLAPGALLRDVILVIRADEAHHREVNHQFADELTRAQG
jgi:ubiquinol oxidase